MDYNLRIFCVEDINLTRKLVSFFFGHCLLIWCPAAFGNNERKTCHCKETDSLLFFIPLLLDLKFWIIGSFFFRLVKMQLSGTWFWLRS